jgi:hypothetical protein
VSSKDEFESLPFSTHSFIRPQKDPAEQVVELLQRSWPVFFAAMVRCFLSQVASPMSHSHAAWLMREDVGDRYEQLLERLSALPDSTEVQVS